GKFALVIEHQGLKATGLHRLDLGHDVVEVIQRLDARIERVGVIADRADRYNLHAVFVDFGRVQRNVVHDDDDLRIARFARIQAEIAGPGGDDQADVTVALIVCFDRAGNRLHHLFTMKGDFELDAPGSLIEPIDVFAQTEDLRVVNPDTFE